MKGSHSIRQGWKAYSTGAIERADAEFLTAIQQAPDSSYPAIQRGLFLLREDRFSEATESLEGAAKLAPANPAPLFFLALAQELNGEAEVADQTLSSLAALCPRHQGLASLKLLQEIRRGDPRTSLALLGFGRSAKDSGNSASGWRSLVAGIGAGDPAWLPPDLSSSQYVLGPILVEIETRLLPREIPILEHGQSDLLKDVESNKAPKRHLRDEIAGLRNSMAGGPKLRKGRRLLERALAIESLAEQKAELRRAGALLRLGRRLDPFAFRTAFHLGEAYLFAAKGAPGGNYDRFSLRKAESYFLESAQQDGINPYVLFYLALTQHLLGRPKTAIDGYTKATEKFAKLPEAHYGMGQCHLLLRQNRQAREFLLQAVDSDLAIARERLGLFADLLVDEGPVAFERPLPELPPPPPIVSEKLDTVEEDEAVESPLAPSESEAPEQAGETALGPGPETISDA